jgi:broad specificity phosphatase PhoE
MSGTPVRIFLARHGETVFNVEGRWQGQSDSPLTERGLAQARELGRALNDEPIAAIYSSDLGRAFNTALEVARPHGLAVIAEERLREIDCGDWVGQNRHENDASHPGMRELWSAAPAHVRLPGGETLLETQTRALAFFAERMPEHAGQSVVVIGHGAICQTILINGMGGTVDDLWGKGRVDNCQISRLEWTPTDGLKLIDFSDVSHLAEVGSLGRWVSMDTA